MAPRYWTDDDPDGKIAVLYRTDPDTGAAEIYRGDGTWEDHDEILKYAYVDGTVDFLPTKNLNTVQKALDKRLTG
jgi:hypothetical protein